MLTPDGVLIVSGQNISMPKLQNEEKCTAALLSVPSRLEDKREQTLASAPLHYLLHPVLCCHRLTLLVSGSNYLRKHDLQAMLMFCAKALMVCYISC